MENLTIVMKEKHLCYVIKHLSAQVMNKYVYIYNQVRDALKAATVGPDDFIEVSIAPQDLYTIYYEMGIKPEGKVSLLNKQMKEILAPQIGYLALYVAEESAVWLYEQIVSLEAGYDQQLSNETAEGRALLLQ